MSGVPSSEFFDEKNFSFIPPYLILNIAREKTSPIGADFVGRQLYQDPYPAINAATLSNPRGRKSPMFGVSKGIRRNIAITYARTDVAAIDVGACSRFSGRVEELQDAAKKARKREPKIPTMRLDVENWAVLESAVKEVEADLGRVDILADNPGYFEPAVPIADRDLDEWWKTWAVVTLINERRP